MKKIMFIALVVMLAGPMRPAFAEGTLLDQFYAGFVGNAKFAIESTTDGVSRPEFLDNFIEIGQVKGEHIAAIDAGIAGTILPESGQVKAAQWSLGAKLHLAPIIKNYVPVPEQWAFLKTLEIDARGSYDFTLHHPFYGIVCAYPWR